jgi:branched-chain amino acid transport system substrate-binding protein
MMQVLGEAVQRVGKIDQEKIADDIHSHEFRTVVGNVRFAKNGEWAEGRPLYVQYRGIKTGALDEWKKPGHAVVLYPAQWKSGELLYPYDQNRK